MMKLRIVLLGALFSALCTAGFAQSNVKAAAPDALVRTLYRAHDTKSGPFFQKKSRALVDRYFTKELGDLIWKDAVTSNDGVGALDFDPLYNAQDVRIRALTVGKPEYVEGHANAADVRVTFMNMGARETVVFRLEKGARRGWKIADISYPIGGHTLKGILSYVPSDHEPSSDIRQVDFRNFDFGALCEGEHKFFAPPVERLVLKKGHQQLPGDSMNYADLASVDYVDFDGDGSEEAFVVVDGQSSGSSNTYLTVYVFAYRDGRAVKIWSQCEENSVAILKGRSIIFKRPEWTDEDAHCCFSYVRTDTYGWKGSEMAVISTVREKTGGGK